MRKISLILYLLLASFAVIAQDITRFEHFFDTDPGYGLGTITNVTPAATITDFDIPISTSSLSAGFHKLYIRAQNATNQWTHTHLRSFYILPLSSPLANITQIEYFIDTDPGVGLGTQVSFTAAPTITNLAVDISAVPLTPGFHKLYVRSKSSDGQWTHTQLRSFYIANVGVAQNLVKFEYFFDTDPGFDSGIAAAITPAVPSVTNQDIFADVSGLTVGSHTVYVRAKDSGGEWTQVSTGAFSVTAVLPPTITSFTPVSGPAGTTVVITGTNFSGATTVSFGGIAATSFSVTSPTSITAFVGAGASGNVSVTTIGGTAALAGFSFTPSPTITSFTPVSGTTGTTVTITGTNFAGATAVSFGGIAATSFTVVSSSSITAVVSTGASGSVSVTTASGIASLAGFTFISLPTITSFTPASGPTGSTVTITGTNFTGATSVTFGGTAATSFTVVSATSITAIVGTTASGAIAVTTPGGIATSVSAFTITPTNTITISQQPTSVSLCEGAVATFTITSTGTTNIVYQWQKFNGTVFTDVANGGGYGGATSSVLTITTAGTFGAGDYRCKVSGDLAPNVFSNTATLTINPIPIAPGSPIGASLCGSGSVTVSVSGGTNGQYRWYTVATGGTSITGQTNSSFTTPSLTTTTTYFVSIDNGSCESTRTAVIATINPTPSAPTATGALVCPGTTITLNASGGTAGQYRWYTVATGGSAISGQTNSSLTTPTLTTTTTYYVAINNGCESVRIAVIATVSPAACTPPSITTQALATQIGGKVTLNLVPLIATPNSNLNISSLQVTKQPASGAIATISPTGILTIDYTGISFSGIEEVGIRACDLNGNCAIELFNIEVTDSITVYNAVSPNGANPTFFIQYIELLLETKNNSVSIFDRWQNEVWSASNYNNSSVVFKGVSNSGSDLPTGIYFYKIEFNSGKKMQAGFISLKR